MKTSSGGYWQICRCYVITGICILLWCPYAGAIALSDVPTTIINNLDSGVPQDVIVLYDDQEVEKESEGMRRKGRLKHDDETILAHKVRRYRDLKDTVETGFTTDETETVADYSHLPMTFKRFRSRTALQKFLLRPGVKAVYENRPIYPHLTYSLPFIGQPSAVTAGFSGSGQTVLVIDSGVNYTLSAFGSCTKPGVPAGCRILAAVDVNGSRNLVTTAGNHGTNIAGRIAGVAPGSHIASFNALPGGSGTDSTVIAGINWGIANKNFYGITTINMSLGGSANYSVPCSSSGTNPYVTPIVNARSAGILAVASSGNNAYTDGISSPACTPGVISVGAVYDTTWNGPFTWSSGCTDSTNGPDKIPCFSNSASFLTMLAPGAFITAAGIQMAGTSQASPHVAGAAAVLQAAFPTESLDQIVTRMTATGVKITDSRNGVTVPRLSLLATISPPANDLFNNRTILNGETGALTAQNFNATPETSEAHHAGVIGGRSVWWSWTAPSSGVVAIDTHGSTFDTLLAVYTGTTLSSLVSIAANDNDGSVGYTSSVSFIAEAGTTYQIAVDGVNGAAGQISLNWSLDQQADLTVSMSGPNSTVSTDETVAYDLVITNRGPSSATGVAVSDTLPAGSIIDSLPPVCSESFGTVNCSFAKLTPGESAAVQITLHFATPGVYLNSAQVSATTKDPVLTNNTATLSVTDIPIPAVPVPGLPLPLAGIAALALTFLAAHNNSDKNRTGAMS